MKKLLFTFLIIFNSPLSLSETPSASVPAQGVGPTQKQIETLPENIKSFEMMRAKIQKPIDVSTQQKNAQESKLNQCKQNLNELVKLNVPKDVLQKSMWWKCVQEIGEKK